MLVYSTKQVRIENLNIITYIKIESSEIMKTSILLIKSAEIIYSINSKCFDA
jgi:hypothetical protein